MISKSPGSTVYFIFGIVERQQFGRDVEGDGARFAGFEDHAAEALQLFHRPRGRAEYVANVHLHRLAAGCARRYW
jgi:hypothetical protein